MQSPAATSSAMASPRIKHDVATLLCLDGKVLLSHQAKQSAEAVFKEFDHDASGKIPEGDLRKMFDRAASAPEQMKAKLFSQMSVGLDQTVSLDQFSRVKILTSSSQCFRNLRRGLGEPSTSKSKVKGAAKRPGAQQKASRVFRTEGMSHCYVWVRGDPLLNRLSNTKAFDMAVLRDTALRNVHVVFGEIDVDGTGRVSLRELKTYLKHKAPSLLPMATGIFNQLDPAGRGKVSFKQMMKMLFPTAPEADLKTMVELARPQDQQRKNKSMDQELLVDVSEIFRIYDDNGDGTLDLEEFVSAMGVCGFEDEDNETVFASIDTDGSGTVSLDEFIAWYVEQEQPAAREDSSSDEEDD
ncbi:hypothetical protein BSKO_08179 [Bryopsis sp. KO-2023]|nr:hypothetical protein BSKO_08179 [Bryopsis sp. KO-2023]